MGTGETEIGPASTEQAAAPLVVGIGASAGGLAALERLLPLVEVGRGIALVVVQHLDSRRPSMLVGLLGNTTTMPVLEARDGAPVEADHVYVIPPAAHLSMANGCLRVIPGEKDHDRIDAFFAALAADQGQRAVGIVLSGSGRDGTRGLGAIRGHGGLTLAQRPESAEHGDMPASAIAAGVVDHVLPIEEMPVRLTERAAEIAGRPQLSPSSSSTPSSTPSSLDAELDAELGSICLILQRATGHDFSRYRRGTLLRRIRHRMQQASFSSVGAYVDLLASDPRQPELLVKDLLVVVTGFFRDPQAFEYLAGQVLPRLLGAKPAGEAVRIWVPGCASGEEAYSLAMLLRERLEEAQWPPLVQIFATDVDGELLAEARRGRYPAEIAEQVPPERLARFFGREGAGYRVAKELREMCLFSQHSLIRDPPFSSLDLISCRNLLIYLEAELQKRLIPLFHYALRPGGYLFLGPSEGTGGHAGLFEVVDKHHRVFRRVEPLIRPAVELPLTSPLAARALAPAPEASRPPGQAAGQPARLEATVAAFQQLLLQEYTPASAIVDGTGQVLCVAGLTGRYLQPPVGALRTNVLDIAHASLRIALRTALHAAATSHGKVVRDDLHLEVDESLRRLRLTVRPFAAAAQAGNLFLVVIEERQPGPLPAPAEQASELELLDGQAIAELESELRATRADLSVTIEDLEAANEELKSSNEELISTNEELQSTNEELQTSQEELRSVNEELETVNAELRRKLEELATANSDLRNLFAATNIATLFLDRQLVVTKFTPAAKALFHLLDSDAGRPLSDLAPRLAGQDLDVEVREVLRTLRPIERQVQAADGRAWFVLRVLPYRTVDDVVAGVVVTLVDISELKRTEMALRESEQRYSAIFEKAPFGTCLHKMPEVILVAVNDAFLKVFELTREETLGKTSIELGLSTAEERARLLAELGARGSLRDFEVRRRAKSGAERILSVNIDWVNIEGKRFLLSTFNDITERRHAEDTLRESRQQLELAHERLLEMDRRRNHFLAVLSHELRNPLTPIRTGLFMLERAEPGSEQARRAQAVIGRQIGHLTRLVNDLLDTTRVSRGMIALKRERLELGDLVRQSVEDHRAIFAEHGIALELQAATQAVLVSGDRTRLSQVIGNLLQNAVKFTPAGGLTSIQVALSSETGQAVVRVRDTGSGIPREILAHLFEPFTQADTSLDRGKGGLGLGLALVKGLVELHGGSVQVESEGPDCGTTLTVHLPIEAEPTSAKDGPTGVARRLGLTRRVLVIEDNADTAAMLKDALDYLGYAVEVANSGPAGLERTRASRPDVVLCDIGLPGMDGYAVARAMRADSSLQQVALVAMTGYTRPEDIAQAKQAGFDAHLAKPMSIDRIEDLLVEVLEARGQGPSKPGP